MPKRAGAFKGEKRQKELSRLKRQEEKRQRRFHKGEGTSSETEKLMPEEAEKANP